MTMEYGPNTEPNTVLLRHLKRRKRWAFFTKPSISLIGAIFYVAIGFAIGAYLFGGR